MKSIMCFVTSGLADVPLGIRRVFKLWHGCATMKRRSRKEGSQMGRETVAVCHWGGDVAEVKVHLSNQFLELRGDVRVDIPRAAIQDVAVVKQGVQVRTDGPMLLIELGQTEAARWQKALLKAPPTLAAKLGISAAVPAFLFGTVDDASLMDALAGARAASPDDAAILIAILLDPADLQRASDLALANPDKHIWMVHEKGKQAAVGDTAVRKHKRDLGFVDSKTSAVSDLLTTTRYRLRKA
jgi:hypothetical protein